LTERKRRARTKTHRNTTNVDDATTQDKEIASAKKQPNLDKHKKEPYFRNEQESSITALVGNTSSDEFEGFHHPRISSETQNTFDDDYKKAVSVVRIKEQPIFETRSFRPVIFSNSNAQEYLASLQQTIFSVNESRERDSFFELRRTDYHDSILSMVTFWQKTLYNWLKICKDFNDYTTMLFREYWMMPYWFISGGKVGK
jgi:hypothetical protein